MQLFSLLVIFSQEHSDLIMWHDHKIHWKYVAFGVKSKFQVLRSNLGVDIFTFPLLIVNWMFRWEGGIFGQLYMLKFVIFGQKQTDAFSYILRYVVEREC